MNTDDIRAELEAELTWRSDEMRFLENQLANFSSEREKDKYRRSLIVMLYSHLEGFFKFAFTLYTDIINEQNLKCEDVTAYMAVSSLSNIFRALDDPDKKSDIFRRSLPDDTALHRFCRRVDFIKSLSDINNKSVKISDKVVDTKSNLTPVVIKKILYQLGFEHTKFDQYKGNIDKLLNVRNHIAHGDNRFRAGVEENDYNAIKNDTYSIMNEIILMITDELRRESFRRT